MNQCPPEKWSKPKIGKNSTQFWAFFLPLYKKKSTQKKIKMKFFFFSVFTKNIKIDVKMCFWQKKKKISKISEFFLQNKKKRRKKWKKKNWQNSQDFNLVCRTPIKSGEKFILMPKTEFSAIFLQCRKKTKKKNFV